MRAPPRGLTRLLVRRVGGALLSAQLGGVLVLVLATLAEHGGDDAWGELRARVPSAASLAAGALALLGGALACGRALRDGTVRGLAACGVSEAAFVWAAAAFGVPCGLAARWAAGVGGSEPTATYPVRGLGGWWIDGVALPDVTGGIVGPPPEPAGPGWALAATPVMAAALGAVVGLRGWRGGAVVVAACVVIGEGLARGLVERAAVPAIAAWVPAAACAAAVITARVRPRRGARAPTRGTPPTPAS